MGPVLSLWRKLLRQRPPEPEPPAPRADADRIAVLEHDLLGVIPEPGTRAARAVALSKPVDQNACPHDEVIETPEFGQPRMLGICRHCGAGMVQNDQREWERP
ncbi:hypothetical protein [Streptomyces sp. NPDC008092]|uniref:hypothetical protein n=1 Tax=Streptomyces sp. NPDC008092 TaxID=3364808 RepID=UPI0036E3C9A1